MITSKSDLIERMAAKHGRDFSHNTMRVLVDSMLDEIGKPLRDGKEVRLHGFGSFSVTERKATTGRNPRTGEKIEIAARKAVKFKASSALAATVNG